MNNWLRRAVSLLAGGVVLAGPFLSSSGTQARSSKTASRPNFNNVQALIEQKISHDHIPSICVAVASNGKIVWEKGFGWANRERKLAARENTMYSLASVTKLMTASAIMVLSDRRLLDFDRPVNDYLGPSKLTSQFWNPAGATVGRVATHTAGLPTYDNGYACRSDDADCQDIMIHRFGVLIWRPGERFDHSHLV